jgi:predicted dinucleotide-binding enzyme
MKIAIIGAGNVGTGIAKRLRPWGHEIVLSFSRDPDALKTTAAALGVTCDTTSKATAASEIVILATPWAATQEALRQAGPLGTRILWDATNPLKPDLSGLVLGTDRSGGEQVAAWADGGRVVKAIPPFAELLHAESLLIDGGKPGVFVCGEDAEARRIVAGLVAELGADGVDAGPLSLARYTEPLGMLLVHLAYVGGMGARIGSQLLRDPIDL